MSAEHRKPLLIHVTTVPMTLPFLRGQIGYMGRAGLEVLVVSSPGASLTAFGDAEKVRTAAVEMRRAFSPARDLVALWRLWQLFRWERPLIVHAHTPKAGLLAMVAAWLAGVRIRVFHLHGLPHMTAAGLRHRVLIACTKLSCRLANRVFCVSASVRDLAVAGRLCAAHRAVVPAAGSINGVDSHFFQPDKYLSTEFRRRLGLERGELAIGFAGRLVADKGIAELDEVWQTIRRDFPAAHLILAGDVERHTPLAPELVASLTSDRRVHWLGWQSDMRGFYAGLDLLVLPSYREGLPTVVLEAAASGVPCVATDVTGCVDAVANGVTGTLVPARDAAALKRAISAYLASPELRAAHGGAARAHVLSRYRPETIWQATLAEYQALARGCELRGKRLLDVTVSLILLLLTAPIMLLIAAAIRLACGAPVLFRQQRPGCLGRAIEVFKFRTMAERRDEGGCLLPDEQRLTPLGQFLRAASLDELPQLWNVLRGDMSLVGPRPLLPRYLPRYSPRQARRHEVRPGITGWAQIHGRNTTDWSTRLELDVWYVDHRSVALDLEILLRTIVGVLRRSGISHGGHATMPEFQGGGQAQ